MGEFHGIFAVLFINIGNEDVGGGWDGRVAVRGGMERRGGEGGGKKPLVRTAMDTHGTVITPTQWPMPR